MAKRTPAFKARIPLSSPRSMSLHRRRGRGLFRKRQTASTDKRPKLKTAVANEGPIHRLRATKTRRPQANPRVVPNTKRQIAESRFGARYESKTMPANAIAIKDTSVVTAPPTGSRAAPANRNRASK
jgi:hypothetical protein